MNGSRGPSAAATGAPPPAPGGRCLVAVDGIDGSGKSMLAGRLAMAADAAGVPTVTLAVDDFRRPVRWGDGGRSEADIYYDDYYDLALLDRCLSAFLAGTPFVDIPRFDAAGHRLDGQRRIDFAGAVAAIVEGIFILRVPLLAQRAGVVYLRTSFAAARQRVLARDTARGRSAADVEHRIRCRYFPGQERYLREYDPVGQAHVVLDNEDWRAPALLRLESERWREKLSSASPLAKQHAPAAADLAAILSGALSGFATPATVG